MCIKAEIRKPQPRERSKTIEAVNYKPLGFVLFSPGWNLDYEPVAWLCSMGLASCQDDFSNLSQGAAGEFANSN